MDGFAFGEGVPEGGLDLLGLEDPVEGWVFRTGERDGGTIAARTVTPVEGMPFDEALRIEVLRPGANFWEASLGATGVQSVRKGDRALIRLFLRAVESSDETGLVALDVYVEGPEPEYSKSIFTTVTAGSEWREIFLPFVFNDDYEAADIFVYLGFGQTGKPMTMEIGGVELLLYEDRLALADLPRTKIEYVGMEPDAPWRAAADARIEQDRKGNFSIRVVDPAGDPVEGASVEVEMVRHAFQFGSVVNAFQIMGEGEGDRVYREKFLELFNAGGLENDTKWGAWIGEWKGGSRFSQAQTLEALDWMKQQDLHLRGHVLVWPGEANLPRRVTKRMQENDPAVPDLILEHIDDVTSATRPYLDEWDVINEPYNNHDLMDQYGKELMADWFVRARENLPTADLYLNDFGILSDRGRNFAHQDHLKETIRYLLSENAPITGIGLQGHMGEAATEPDQLLNVLNSFADSFPELKIRITEFDINTKDETFQANYLRDFMWTVFSHPQVVGIQMWGFWEGAHWRPDAALYRRDWSAKPSLDAYRSLVFDRWWTSLSGTTGADGIFEGRGFLGDYRAVISRGRNGSKRNSAYPWKEPKSK